jgi:hypothetical protein
MITLEEKKQRIMDAFDNSRYLAAAHSVGFTFTRPEIDAVSSTATGSHLYVRGRFKCLCGTIESYCIDMLMHVEIFDPIEFLHLNGSFSEAHLLEDGYSPEQAAQISSKYNDAIWRGMYERG